MNVILLEKIAKLGDIGEAVRVKSGYARNFLFPKGKAVPATKQNVEDFEQRRSELMAAHNDKIALAQGRAEKLADLSIALEVNASDEGRLFGSVSSREVAESVNAKAGSDLVKAEVILPGGAIRQCGDYEVTVDLGYEVTATIALSVINPNAPVQAKEEPEPAAEEASDVGATGGRPDSEAAEEVVAEATEEVVAEATEEVVAEATEEVVAEATEEVVAEAADDVSDTQES